MQRSYLDNLYTIWTQKIQWIGWCYVCSLTSKVYTHSDYMRLFHHTRNNSRTHNSIANFFYRVHDHWKNRIHFHHRHYSYTVHYSFLKSNFLFTVTYSQKFYGAKSQVGIDGTQRASWKMVHKNDFEAIRWFLESLKINLAGNKWDLPLQDQNIQSIFVD